MKPSRNPFHKQTQDGLERTHSQRTKTRHRYMGASTERRKLAERRTGVHNRPTRPVWSSRHPAAQLHHTCSSAVQREHGHKPGFALQSFGLPELQFFVSRSAIGSGLSNLLDRGIPPVFVVRCSLFVVRCSLFDSAGGVAASPREHEGLLASRLVLLAKVVLVGRQRDDGPLLLAAFNFKGR